MSKATTEQIEKAINVTRGGWQDATEQQRAHCWAGMDEQTQNRALQLAAMSDDDRAKFLQAERVKARKAHSKKTTNPNK